MKVAFGFSAHSGWAALVVVGKRDGDFVLVDRERVTLVDETWAKAPYHAAETKEIKVAREMVAKGIESANRVAVRELRGRIKREQQRQNEVQACAVLVGSSMPDWTVDEILAVHFRMHKAEGVLFRDALIKATQACGVRPVPVPQKLVSKEGEKALRISEAELSRKIAEIGKSAGPPWGKDQKDAAVAAMIALSSEATSARV